MDHKKDVLRVRYLLKVTLVNNKTVALGTSGGKCEDAGTGAHGPRLQGRKLLFFLFNIFILLLLCECLEVQ